MKRFVSTFVFVVILILLTGQVVLAAPPQQGGGMVHTVQTGENLYGIAARYGVSAEAIMRQNGLVNPDMIYAGQALIIPGGAYNPAPMHPYPGGYGCANAYTVQMGDTLSGIAWNFGVTTEALLRSNNLYNANFVYVGQRLCVPPPASYAPQPASYGHNYGPPVFVPAPPPAVPGPGSWGYHQPPPSHPKPPCGCTTPTCGCPPPAPAPKPTPKPTPKPPTTCGCDTGPQCKCPPKFELLFDRKEYETWHRPANGLTQCTGNDGPYDILSQPIQRITVAVFLTNKSDIPIPGDWAYSENVILHTVQGAARQACVWPTNTTVQPGKSVNVTFYTHLEPGDSIKDIHFTRLRRCMLPNNGFIMQCDHPTPAAESALPGFP